MLKLLHLYPYLCRNRDLSCAPENRLRTFCAQSFAHTSFWTEGICTEQHEAPLQKILQELQSKLLCRKKSQTPLDSGTAGFDLSNTIPSAAVSKVLGI